MADLKLFFGDSFSPPPGIAEYEGSIIGPDKISALTILFSNILKIAIYGGLQRQSGNN
jgi:hypothetical protein